MMRHLMCKITFVGFVCLSGISGAFIACAPVSSGSEESKDGGETIVDTASVPESATDSHVESNQTPRGLLFPLYPDCKQDSECQAIDTNLSCQYDAYSQKDLCQLPKGELPYLSFPKMQKGESLTRSVALRNVGSVPMRVNSIHMGGRISGDCRLDTEGMSFPLTMASGEQKIFKLKYIQTDVLKPWCEVIVNSDGITEAYFALKFKH